MAGTGGFRPGAGRPKGLHTKQAEEAKKLLVDMFVKEREPIFKALISQAKTGSAPHIKELFERVWGKVPQLLQDNDGQAVMPFQIVITKINGEDTGKTVR